MQTLAIFLQGMLLISAGKWYKSDDWKGIGGDVELHIMGIALLVGLLALLVAHLWLLVVAFSTSLVWGVCVLLVPFASVVFVVVHFDRSRKPLFVWLCGIVLSFGGLVGAFMDGYNFGKTMALSRQLIEQKKYDEAEALLKKCLDRHSMFQFSRARERAETQLELAKVYEKTNRIPQAKSALQDALDGFRSSGSDTDMDKTVKRECANELRVITDGQATPSTQPAGAVAPTEPASAVHK